MGSLAADWRLASWLAGSGWLAAGRWLAAGARCTQPQASPAASWPALRLAAGWRLADLGSDRPTDTDLDCLGLLMGLLRFFEETASVF